jgi:hypothetical protein
MKPVHTIPPYFKIHFNIILPHSLNTLKCTLKRKIYHCIFNRDQQLLHEDDGYNIFTKRKTKKFNPVDFNMYINQTQCVLDSMRWWDQSISKNDEPGQGGKWHVSNTQSYYAQSKDRTVNIISYHSLQWQHPENTLSSFCILNLHFICCLRLYCIYLCIQVLCVLLRLTYCNECNCVEHADTNCVSHFYATHTQKYKMNA